MGPHEFARRRRGKIEYFVTFAASAVAREGHRGVPRDAGGCPMQDLMGAMEDLMGSGNSVTEDRPAQPAPLLVREIHIPWTGWPAPPLQYNVRI